MTGPLNPFRMTEQHSAASPASEDRLERLHLTENQEVYDARRSLVKTCEKHSAASPESEDRFECFYKATKNNS